MKTSPPAPAPQVPCLGIAQLKDGACALVLLHVSPEPASQGRRQRVASQRILYSSTDRERVERQFREDMFNVFVRQGEARAQPSAHKPEDIEHAEALGMHQGPGRPKLPWLVVRVETQGVEVTKLEALPACASRMDACDEMDREAALNLLIEERRRYVRGLK